MTKKKNQQKNFFFFVDFVVIINNFIAPPMSPVIYGSEKMTLLEGETLSLTCESQGGNPLATLTWFRGIEKVLILHSKLNYINQVAFVQSKVQVGSVARKETEKFLRKLAFVKCIIFFCIPSKYSFLFASKSYCAQ